jgi:hypothetical protein
MVLWSRIGVVILVLGVLSACGEPDPAENIEWAIDPEVTGADRELLRKALAIVFEECPALAEVDWEAAIKREGDYSEVLNYGAEIRDAGPDLSYQPMIEGWRRFGVLGYDSPPPHRVGSLASPLFLGGATGDRRLWQRGERPRDVVGHLARRAGMQPEGIRPDH